MTPEVVIINVAKFLGGQLLKWGYKKATENTNDEYTQELFDVIQSTITEYAKAHPVQETDRIPFYKSEVLLQEFLKFRFHHELDQSVVRKAIEADPKIIVPTARELDTFYHYFMKAVDGVEKLKQLDISVNYKEEIFKISSFLLEFRNELNETIAEMKRDISMSQVAMQLIDDWNRQLDEIVDNLRSFKAKTALERLEKLEQAITEQSITKDTLLSKIYGLQADALGLLYGIDGSEERDRQAKLFIKVYKLSPTNLNTKSNAALAYMTLSENEKADQLADEVLAEDEFNLGAWLAKCFLAGPDFANVIAKVPKSLVKTDAFKLNFYRWLASNRYIKNSFELEKFGLNLSIEMPETIKVNYKNLHYLQLTAVYLINLHTSRYPTILSVLQFPQAQESAEFKYAFKILEACSNSIRTSEVTSYYLFYEFYFHILRFALFNEDQDIVELERIFNQMGEERKDPEIIGRMMQGYNSLGKTEYYKKSLALAEEFEKSNGPAEFINILKAGTAVLMGDVKMQAKYFIDYLRFYDKIDDLAFHNFVSFLRNTASRIDEDSKREIAAIANKAQFDRPILQRIMMLFCAIVLKVENLDQEAIAKMTDEARQAVDLQDESLCVHVAFAYVLTDRLLEAREFIKSYIDFNVLSESYILYCKLLYQLPEADKSELLALLKKHRESFEIDYELLRIEFWLMQLQGKIKDCIRLAKKGVELFPRSEFFVQWLFISLHKDAQLNEIRNYAELAASFPFRDEQVIVSIANVLINASVFPGAVDLLFKYASKSENTQVRQAYFMLSHTFPPDSMKEFQEVTSGCFVKYQVNDQVKILEITEENKDRHPYKLFLGKTVGETFSYTKSFDSTLEMFKVVRIMDQYLALFEQIMADSEDPLSDMPIKKIEFKGDSIEDFHRAFIEAVGISGSLQKEHTEKQYEKYFNGQISFAEIANSVFRQELIDAYFMLTNQYGKPFRAIPQVLGHSNFSEKTSLVLDPTSLCLFYLLEKESGFVFTRKFVISPFLRQLVFQELEKTKREEFGISVAVTMERVIPHKYDDEFKDRRIETFEGLLNWIDAHCEIADIPERLNIISALESSIQQEIFWNIYIDNRLLIDRQDYFLLTNDAFYVTHFAMGLQYAINPVCYLSKYHSEKQQDFTSHFLKHNYVGIFINASTLYDEFFKMLSGQENGFLICLENLRFSSNPDTRHISEAVIFIKNLCINSVISETTRDQWTLAVLQTITTGMNERLKKVLQIMIKREFRMLGLHEIRVSNMLAAIIGR